MAEDLAEQSYLVPSHLGTQQSVGPFPARLIYPTVYAGVFVGLPMAVSEWKATGGLLPAAVGAALIPPLLISPIAAWWLNPPAEHGIMAAAGFVKRAYAGSQTKEPKGLIAVYRMPTQNLETASAPNRRAARAQWGSILNGLTHPIKIIIRGRPLTTLPVVEELKSRSDHASVSLGQWLEDHLSQHGLVERERLLVIPAKDSAELQFRTTAIEKTLRQARMEASRVPDKELALLRTQTWDPKATEAREAPEFMEEGTTEVQVDGWWTRAYTLGQFPPAILTNWASPLFAGDEPLDVAMDVVPQDPSFVKQWVVEVKIRQLETSSTTSARAVALEQLYALRDALERRRVVPFEVAMTVLVRGTSRQNVKDRSDAIVQQTKTLGAKLRVLRWEQAAGLMQLDPTRTKPMRRREHLIETGTLARTYPWSDGYLQLPNGVPWGEAGNRPCLFTPWVKGNRGTHMAGYGTTNAGKGMGFHLLWSRMHLIQGTRIFGIDQDEQHEHCGRFLEYLGGRKLSPRDVKDAADIVLHKDDGVVILDLSEVDEDKVGGIFAAWAKVVKKHMLAHAGPSVFFVDEAVTVSEDPAGDRALRDSFQRSRHWNQSSHVLTQRPTSWFNTLVGRAIQGNCDAWWCGAQQPKEVMEVAEALELTDEERGLVRNAGIGTGLLVSGRRRVWLDLFDRMSPSEYNAFHSDPVVVSIDDRKRGVG